MVRMVLFFLFTLLAMSTQHKFSAKLLTVLYDAIERTPEKFVNNNNNNNKNGQHQQLFTP